jgi:hypothetical protein
MKLYTWNIPEISHFLKYDRYMSWIFHTYDTVQIPDAVPVRVSLSNSSPASIPRAAGCVPARPGRRRRGVRGRGHPSHDIPRHMAASRVIGRGPVGTQPARGILELLRTGSLSPGGAAARPGGILAELILPG